MNAVDLSRRQAKRLRHYFERGARAYRTEFDGIDLDLLGHGLIERKESGFGGDQVSLTPLGLESLHQFRQKDIATRQVHHTLGERLANHLRKKGRITWENIEFRNQALTKTSCGVTIDYVHWQFSRPDVFSIVPSLNPERANPCVHEVKISRSDFLCDKGKPEKRASYAAMAEAVYYVAPEGIISPEEIPDGFGLLVERTENEFVLLKRPKKRKVQLQPWHYLNMIVKKGVFPEENEVLSE